MLALIPSAPPKAPNGLVEEEPNDPNDDGPNEAGEKAPASELLDIAAIGFMPDMAPSGLEKDIPGKPP